MPGFLHNLFLPLWTPRRGLERLLRDPAGPAHAGLALLMLGLAYSLTLAVGYLRGFGAVTPPFVAIPAESYYAWEAVFAPAVFFVVAVLFAGTARLICRAFGGTGRFEPLFALTGIALTLPMALTMWLPETVLIVLFPAARASAMGGFAVLPIWLDTSRQVVGIVWPLAIIAMGLKRSEGCGWGLAVSATILAFLPGAALIALLIR